MIAEVRREAKRPDPDAARLVVLISALADDEQSLRVVVDELHADGNGIVQFALLSSLYDLAWDRDRGGVQLVRELAFVFVRSLDPHADVGVTTTTLSVLSALQARDALDVSNEDDGRVLGRFLVSCLDTTAAAMVRSAGIELVGDLWADGGLVRFIDPPYLPTLRVKLSRLRSWPGHVEDEFRPLLGFLEGEDLPFPD